MPGAGRVCRRRVNTCTRGSFENGNENISEIGTVVNWDNGGHTGDKQYDQPTDTEFEK